MKWMWDKNLRTNTVFVEDAVRALWDMAAWYTAGQAKFDKATMGPTPIFNVVDNGATTQGTLAAIIGDVFQVKTGFQGSVMSNLARLNMDNVVEDVNDDVLGPWAELLTEAGITRPGPLTPFMEKELLKDTDLSMDGSRLTEIVGWKPTRSSLTKESVEEIIESYKKMNWWP